MKKSLIMFGAATAAVVGWAGVAGAQGTGYAGDEENPAVVQSELPAPSSTDTAAAATTQVQATTQTLPVTGADTTGIALAGVALVAGGGALVWRSRVAQAAA